METDIFDVETFFPIQLHDNVIFTIRYKKSHGLTTEKMNITNCNTYNNYNDAINAYIEYALKIAKNTFKLNNKLISTLLKTSFNIAKDTSRSCGNFLIGNEQLIKNLLNENELQIIETKCQLTGTNFLENLPFSGVSKIFNITCLYKDLKNKLLVGYHGSKIYDTGIVIGQIDNKFTVSPNFINTEYYYSIIEI